MLKHFINFAKCTHNYGNEVVFIFTLLGSVFTVSVTESRNNAKTTPVRRLQKLDYFAFRGAAGGRGKKTPHYICFISFVLFKNIKFFPSLFSIEAHMLPSRDDRRVISKTYLSPPFADTKFEGGGEKHPGEHHRQCTRRVKIGERRAGGSGSRSGPPPRRWYSRRVCAGADLVRGVATGHGGAAPSARSSVRHGVARGTHCSRRFRP